MKIRIATRKSALSIRQVEIVINALKNIEPDIKTELIFVKTKGDIFQNLPPHKIGVKGVFEKEVNLAVIRGEADIAIHSLKDVPVNVSKDIILAAVMPRDSPFEAFLSNNYNNFSELPPQSIIGTSSIRRKAALMNLRHDIKVKPLRGNIDTRIRKLDEGLYDAIVVAEAGVRRLNMGSRIKQIFKLNEIAPAPCQGIIGIYARKDDKNIIRLLKKINDQKTMIEAIIEREIIRLVGGGCYTPLGVYSEVRKKYVKVFAALYSPVGNGKIEVIKELSLGDPKNIAKDISSELLARGYWILEKLGELIER